MAMSSVIIDGEELDTMTHTPVPSGKPSNSLRLVLPIIRS
jgi:hypothetical protein